jgi:hypothetical protein
MKTFRRELWFNLPSAGGSQPEVEAAGESGVQRAGPDQRHAHHRSVFINDDERPASTTKAGSSAGAARSTAISAQRDRRPTPTHLKRQVMGREVVVAITHWTSGREQIFWRVRWGRKKRVLVKVLGEEGAAWVGFPLGASVFLEGSGQWSVDSERRVVDWEDRRCCLADEANF